MLKTKLERVTYPLHEGKIEIALLIMIISHITKDSNKMLSLPHCRSAVCMAPKHCKAFLAFWIRYLVDDNLPASNIEEARLGLWRQDASRGLVVRAPSMKPRPCLDE